MTLNTTALSTPYPSDYPPSGASALGHTIDVARVLRNTYALLAMTLLFSAAVASAAVAYQWRAPGIMLTRVGYFGLLFAIHKFQNSFLLCNGQFTVGIKQKPVLVI